jgi:hypothetical protein
MRGLSLCNLVAEGADEFLLIPLAHVGRADGVHRPVIRFPVRDEGSYADDRVVDVLRKLVADRLADLYVGLSGKVVGDRKPPRSGIVSRSQTMTIGFMQIAAH